MPPVRTVPPIQPVQTQRSHEENQERAYIAASRRSDRSLEARVESARRASEIHKRRTGRSLRVREADVINEEMYEEQDDHMSSHAHRSFALAGIIKPFSNRLQSSLAIQFGMRDAVQQAVQRNQMVLATSNDLMNGGMDASAAAAGANMFASPGVSGSCMDASMLPPQAMQAQQWRGGMNMPGQQQPHHVRAASISSTQHAAATHQQRHQQQQFRNAAMRSNNVVNLRLDARRASMAAAPQQQQQQTRPSHSPAGSHLSIPHGGALHDASPQSHQVPMPSHSASAYTPGHNSSTDSPPMAAAGASMPAQRSNGDALCSSPLTMQLPVETQQMIVFGPVYYGSTANASPSLKPNCYSYNPNGSRNAGALHHTQASVQAQSFGLPPQHAAQFMTMQQLQQMQMRHSGAAPFMDLNQTTSPNALDNNFSADLPSSTVSAPADFSYGIGAVLGLADDYATDGMFGHSGADDLQQDWNLEDFVNFGPPT